MATRPNQFHLSKLGRNWQEFKLVTVGMSGYLSSDLWVRGGMELMAIEQFAKPFPIHFHDTYVIELVVEGTDSCVLDDECVFAAPGDILIINPFQAHSGGFKGSDRIAYRSVYPSQANLDSLSEQWNLRTPVFGEKVVRDPAMTRILAEAHQAATHDQNERALHLALGELIERHASHQSNTSHKSSMNRAARVMLDRCRENRAVEDWATEFGYSTFHFSRRFTRFTGITPHRFLTAGRIDWARKALRAGRRVCEVAVEAGFYDQAHFTRAFQSVIAITPAEYARKSNPLQDIEP